MTLCPCWMQHLPAQEQNKLSMNHWFPVQQFLLLFRYTCTKLTSNSTFPKSWRADGKGHGLSPLNCCKLLGWKILMYTRAQLNLRFLHMVVAMIMINWLPKVGCCWNHSFQSERSFNIFWRSNKRRLLHTFAGLGNIPVAPSALGTRLMKTLKFKTSGDIPTDRPILSFCWLVFGIITHLGKRSKSILVHPYSMHLFASQMHSHKWTPAWPWAKLGQVRHLSNLKFPSQGHRMTTFGTG